VAADAAAGAAGAGGLAELVEAGIGGVLGFGTGCPTGFLATGLAGVSGTGTGTTVSTAGGVESVVGTPVPDEAAVSSVGGRLASLVQPRATIPASMPVASQDTDWAGAERDMYVSPVVE
jgi:hypothetical protein